MNTKKISHIGVLVHDADAATQLWTESFGFKKFEDRKIEIEGIALSSSRSAAPGTRW